MKYNKDDIREQIRKNPVLYKYYEITMGKAELEKFLNNENEPIYRDGGE